MPKIKKILTWLLIIVIVFLVIYWIYGGMSFDQGDTLIDTSKNQLEEALDLLH